MKTKVLWVVIVILTILLVGENQRVNRLTAKCSALEAELYCPAGVVEDLARYSRDEIIMATLLEVWGEELDATYNQADLTECPWEEGNWVLDIASEMDWEDLIPYITALPSFGSDEDCEMLTEITDGYWSM